MKSTLTPLFLAPARVGRLISQVCRCSCGSLSEIYSQYLALPERHMLSPNQLSNCKPSRPDRCHDCESDERRMRAAQWYATMSRRNAGYTTILPNDRKARNPDQAEYFRLAPRQLQPGFVTFKPGEYERATGAQDFSDVQRSFVKATQMLHQRGKDLPLGPAFDRMMQDLANAAYNAPRIPEQATKEVPARVTTTAAPSQASDVHWVLIRDDAGEIDEYPYPSKERVEKDLLTYRAKFPHITYSVREVQGRAP